MVGVIFREMTMGSGWLQHLMSLIHASFSANAVKLETSLHKRSLRYSKVKFQIDLKC
jgi:hypothetical protein